MSRVKLLLSPILISAPAASEFLQGTSPDFWRLPVKFGLKLTRGGGLMTLIPFKSPLWRLSLSKFLSIGFQLYMVRSLRIERLILNPHGDGSSLLLPSGILKTW